MIESLEHKLVVKCTTKNIMSVAGIAATKMALEEIYTFADNKKEQTMRRTI